MRTLTPRRRPRRTTTLAAGALTLAVALTGCGSDGSEDPDDESSDALSIEDPWVIAADDGMTAAFGTLRNDGEEDVVVTAVSSDVSEAHELHETTTGDGSMVMREIEGGFTVPARGTVELEPGGNHLMLMDLTDALEPGEDVDLTLELADGETLEFTAQVRDFQGGDEEYEPSES